MRKNESLDLILKHTRDTVYIMHIDEGPWGKIAFITDNVEKLLGHKAEDFLKNHDLWSSLLHPEDAKGMEEKTRTVLKSGKPARLTYRMLHKKNGHYRWLEDVITPHLDEHGRTIGLAGSVRDITEEKEIEDSLRDSEERFRVVFENASIGIYRSTPGGRVLLANAAMAKILGFPSIDELVKSNLEENDHYSVEFPRSRFRELIETNGSVAGLETKKVRKDGSIFWVRENAHVVRDQNGRVAYYEGTIEDISERKRVEEELEHERSLLKTLIENLPSSIFIKDQEYRKTVVNRQHLINIVRDLNRPDLGSESAILGKTDFDIYPKELAEEYFLDDQKVIRDGQVILDREELRNSPDGKRRWVSISKVPLRDKSGKIVGLLGIASDITNRKLAEEERERERGLLRTLIDHLPNSIFAKDREYKKILANRAHVLKVEDALKLKGLTLDKDILGLTDFEVYPNEMAEEYLLEDRTVIEDGIPIVDREEVIFDANGIKHSILISKIPLRDDKGVITGLVGISTDITGTKRTEEALRASEAELRTLFASMKDIVIVVDKDGRYLRIAPTNPKLLYKPAHELIGKKLHEVFSREQADEFLSFIHTALETGELQNVEYKLDIEGVETWFSASLSKMDKDKVLMVAQDIT